MADRIAAAFARLRHEGRTGFVAYVMGGDPDIETSWAVLNGLPAAGADIVELGFPFTDPTADGPTIALAGRRALKAGATFDAILELARRFRAAWPDTPLILMGYANPLHKRGYGHAAAMMAEAGADGAIVVDLPPEEFGDLDAAMADKGLALIRLTAPTTDASRAAAILQNARGFVYHVAVAGVTGGKSAQADALAERLAVVRAHTDLPIAAGFGVRTPDQARATAAHAEAVVAGSAIVAALDENGPEAALAVARDLAAATHEAQEEAKT